jgi:hypothetical protein
MSIKKFGPTLVRICQSANQLPIGKRKITPRNVNLLKIRQLHDPGDQRRRLPQADGNDRDGAEDPRRLDGDQHRQQPPCVARSSRVPCALSRATQPQFGANAATLTASAIFEAAGDPVRNL